MRKIIIKERVNEPSDFSSRYVFWLTVPISRQSFYTDPLKKSSVKDITAAELASLQNGEFVEVEDTAEFLAGTSIATIQSNLIARYNTLQTQLNNRNPWRFYGSSWDGTTWTVISIT